MKKQKGFNIVLKIMAVILSIGIVIGCMNTESVQAAAKKSSGTTYYATLLNHKRGGRSGIASTGCRERQKPPIIKIPLRFMVHFPRLRRFHLLIRKRTSRNMERERLS